MGLAVAEALAKRGGWEIHLIDMNVSAGEKAAASLPATFHQANCISYPSLSAAFKAVFVANSRLDFVFANAGIAERVPFYKRHDTGIEPPPPFDLSVVDICLDSVVLTSYLALHYFRLTREDVDKNLVMTASCGGIYPSYYSPTYAAAKHGVVGLMRSIAKSYYLNDKIRVNAVCPGVVKTNLLTKGEWGNFPDEFFTPVEKIVETVLILVDGKDKTEGNRIDGAPEILTIPEGKKGVLWGEAVEISGLNHYYREASKLSDASMRAVMKATDIDVLES
jgi:NAD(P)-dependent dehydrogenase (short-subunit alcohol dehydrogenase family)